MPNIGPKTNEERELIAIRRLLLVLFISLYGSQVLAQEEPCIDPVVYSLQYIVNSSAEATPPATIPQDGMLNFEFLADSNCPLGAGNVRFRGASSDSDLYFQQFPMEGAPAGQFIFNGSSNIQWISESGMYTIQIQLDLASFFFDDPVEPGTYRLALDVSTIDGLPSATLISEYTFDVTSVGPAADADGDGVPDGDDNCPSDPNAGQEDWDNDGTGDVCDDADSDGWFDDIDNCISVSNADQADNDLDLIGDACDNDDDNDGVLDGVDNCPFDANPDQTDANGDGFGDVCVPPSSNIDPNADVDPSVDVGEDVQVDKGVEVGANSEIGDGAALDKDVQVGSGVAIGANVEVSQNVDIGDNVFVGEGAILDRGVVLCDNASVGAYAHIGRNSEVGYHGEVAEFEVIGKETFVPGPDPQPTSCTNP